MISFPDLPHLLDRYERTGPRYTSYPPIPSWSAAFGEIDYRAALAECGGSGDPVGVYVHLPFCIARCFYCGCNATVTRDNAVQRRYLDQLERELTLVGEALGQRPRAVHRQRGDMSAGSQSNQHRRISYVCPTGRFSTRSADALAR